MWAQLVEIACGLRRAQGTRQSSRAIARPGAHNRSADVTRRPPRRAPCLARHHQVTKRASFQRVGPGQAWIATSRRGWVIAAWVLGCRARFADSSVKTTRDSRWDRHWERLLAAHSISTIRVTLQSFLPLSGRVGKAPRSAEILAGLISATRQPVALDQDQLGRLSGALAIPRVQTLRSEVPFACISHHRPHRQSVVKNLGAGCPVDPRAVHKVEAARSVIHRFRRARRGAARSQHTADMDPHSLGQTSVVVAIADPELLDQVLSVTAVVGVEPLVLGEPGQLRPHWASASMVLLGADQADRVAAMGLPHRTEVYLVAGETSAARAQQSSIRLGAAVIALPSSVAWLSEALAGVAPTGRATGSIVCVVGGSGGVGASTLAAGLAFVAARASQRTMLIDADAHSGGLDLLLGAERTAGWRWPRLATARGHLGDLTGQLPTVEGVDLLSMARGESTPGSVPQAEQLKSVVLSAMRSHDVTVVDLPPALGAAAREPLRRAKLAVVVVRDDVRGVAAGREVVRGLEGECDRLGLVVRRGRSRLLEADLVATGVGLPLLGSFADDPSLVMAAERGDPPARSARSSLARLSRQLLGDLLQTHPTKQNAPATL
jgi:secretion/DNA translocation related CpaE-like protein